jgi:hypothetical protein
MAKPERSRRHRGQALRNSLRCLMSLLAIGLLGLLGGCGPRPPKSVVQQALAYQISHPAEPVASLVGSDRLAGRLEVQDVQIRQDRREPLLLASGEKLEGHHLSGTYTVIVKPPGSRRPYRRKGDPFQLTLAHQKAQSSPSPGGAQPKTLPERWLLAHPSPDAKSWEVIDFFPQPAPLPELPPAEQAYRHPTDLDALPAPIAGFRPGVSQRALS